jgi:hypothetical protein
VSLATGIFQLSEGLMRPSKVMAKALSAAFHRMTHRARPVPVGSSERVTKYKHFNAA